ncbi:MAG TPA: hypothetical protein PLN21_09325 [Gemmatales bacterium]|nr:hypothetical protein [Gemmatales bacterium]
MLNTFARCVWEPEDIVNLRCLQRDTGKVAQRWDRAGLISSFWLAAQNASMDCYAGVNPRKAVGGSGAADVLLARCLFAEFDNTSLEDASKVVDYAGLPVPTCVVWSGGGPHLYWRLEEPVTDLALWSQCQRRLIRLLGSDRSIHDAPRIMRLPGFFNHKPGRSASFLVWACPHRRFSLAFLASLLPSGYHPIPEVKPLKPFRLNPSADAYQIDLTDVLLRHGWKITRQEERRIYWCRPGKPGGISAVSNPGPKNGRVMFQVFTSNAPPFESGASYSPWAVSALLDHGGDYRKARRCVSLDARMV